MNTNRIGGPPNMGQMFQKSDVNGDGQLDRSEMSTFAQNMPPRPDGSTPSVDEMMSQLDTDGDGQISQEELRAGRPKGPPPPRNGGTEAFADGFDASQLEGMASRFSQMTGQSMSASDLLAAFDTDGDGSVSKTELQEQQQSLQQQLSSSMQAVRMRRR